MARTVILSEDVLFQIQRMEDDGALLVGIDYRTDGPDVDPQRWYRKQLSIHRTLEKTSPLKLKKACFGEPVTL